MNLESKQPTGYRFYEIDLLRFIAAVLVVVYHYLFRGYAADDMSVLSFEFFGPVARYGYLGFHLFFIISGFVILLSSYGKTAADFVISRMVRLYPAYWFCVTATFIVILLLGAPRYEAGFVQYLVNLTMIHGFIGFDSIDGVYWTLMVELKFYFIIFGLIIFKQIKRVKYYLGLWLLLAVVMTFYDVKYLGFFLFPEWSYYFIAGACFYLIHKEGKKPYFFVLLAITYAMAIYYALETIGRLEAHFPGEFHASVIIFSISIFYGLFYLIATNQSKWFNRPGFLVIGALTYPLYLIHENVGFILFNVFSSYANKYVILCAVSAAMLYVSYLINRFIEKKYAPIFKRRLNALIK